jgi:hypothetical protein
MRIPVWQVTSKIEGSSDTIQSTSAFIPTEYRPPYQVFFPVWILINGESSQAYPNICSVQQNGYVIFYNTAQTQSIQFPYTYNVNYGMGQDLQVSWIVS